MRLKLAITRVDEIEKLTISLLNQSKNSTIRTRPYHSPCVLADALDILGPQKVEPQLRVLLVPSNLALPPYNSMLETKREQNGPKLNGRLDRCITAWQDVRRCLSRGLNGRR